MVSREFHPDILAPTGELIKDKYVFPRTIEWKSTKQKDEK